MRSGSEDERGGKPTHSAKIVILEKERKKTVIFVLTSFLEMCVYVFPPPIYRGGNAKKRTPHMISHITVVMIFYHKRQI